MSLAQFPPFPSTPNLPRNSPPTTQSQMNNSTTAGSHRACCENGRPILTDPHTGQTVCSCQYPPGLVSYPRAALPPGLESVYSASAYAAAVSQGFVTLGAEGSAFYSPLGTSPYDLKESAEAWRTLAAAQPGFPYDPMAMYPYGPGKNATRENTNTLKAWLYEHRKNPYPTKGEKIMLAIITKMTLTQVSTWFANARRRLKKENKMTWSPRNRSEDGSDDVDNNEDDDDCGDSRRRDVISPSPQDLDISSSKPSSPLLSPGHDHAHQSNNLFKERIIRVDDDFDDDDEDDDGDASSDSFQHRRLTTDATEGSHAMPSRDRSPLRGSMPDSADEGRARSRNEHLDRKSPSHVDDHRGSDIGTRSSLSPSKQLLSTQTSRDRVPSPRTASPKRNSINRTPPTTTRPKIWSISDFINTTSSSSSSSSSSAPTISTSSSISSSSLQSPPMLNRPPFMASAAVASSSPQRPLPTQGFLFLTPGAASHWQSAAAAAAASRFAGLGGHYPLTLTHSTLSYPYNLTSPAAARVGLEAHAQAVQMAARAAAESGANRDGPTSVEKMSLHPHFPRLAVGSLFSPARDIDGVRSQAMPPARMVVDPSL